MDTGRRTRMKREDEDERDRSAEMGVMGIFKTVCMYVHRTSRVLNYYRAFLFTSLNSTLRGTGTCGYL